MVRSNDVAFTFKNLARIMFLLAEESWQGEKGLKILYFKI